MKHDNNDIIIYYMEPESVFQKPIPPISPTLPPTTNKPLVSSSIFTNLYFIMMVVLILIITLIVSGMQVYNIYKPKTPAQLIKITPTSAFFPTPTSDPTQNWKSYYNGIAGFSFKYPADYFKFVKDYPETGVYLAPDGGNGKGENPKALTDNDVWLDVSLQSGANISSVDEFLNLSGQNDLYIHAQKTPITISGISGYLITRNYYTMAGQVYVKEVILLKNEKLYYITLSAYDAKRLDDYNQMYQQILTTYKFISFCKNCPMFVPPPPGWCDKGQVVPGDYTYRELDNCYCLGPSKCI